MPKRNSKADAHFDTLFGARQGEQIAGGFKLIPRSKIERGSQPRLSFPKEEISELAASIARLREHGEGIEGTGILQAILVTESDEGYRLIAGERRFRASEEAGVEQLPSIVVKMNDNSVLLAQLVENLQRRDLPPLEEARGLDRLMSEQKLSLREAAKVLGKGKGYLENRINLLRMREDVQKMVSIQQDTLPHAREINTVDDPQLRAQLICAVLNEDISHAEVRRRIERSTEQKDKQEGEQTHSPIRKPAIKAMTEEASLNPAQPKLSVRTDTKHDNEARTTPHISSKQDSTASPPDPLHCALRPAVAFTAEFSRQVETLRMTREYQIAVTKELELLKQEIANIERKLNSPLNHS